MTLNDVIRELSAEVLHGNEQDLATPVTTVAAGDLMSDVLARAGNADILVTGLTTTQAIRTASVASIKTVIIVRGKPVSESIVVLAREEGVLLLLTHQKLFEACGRLWALGLRQGTEYM